MNILTQLFTGKDNQTHDLARWLSALIIVVALSLQCYHTLTTGEFDLQQFGTGSGALLAASGFTIRVKASTEPDT